MRELFQYTFRKGRPLKNDSTIPKGTLDSARRDNRSI